jgi:hypothetical protein
MSPALVKLLLWASSCSTGVLLLHGAERVGRIDLAHGAQQCRARRRARHACHD